MISERTLSGCLFFSLYVTWNSWFWLECQKNKIKNSTLFCRLKNWTKPVKNNSFFRLRVHTNSGTHFNLRMQANEERQRGICITLRRYDEYLRYVLFLRTYLLLPARQFVSKKPNNNHIVSQDRRLLWISTLKMSKFTFGQ